MTRVKLVSQVCMTRAQNVVGLSDIMYIMWENPESILRLAVRLRQLCSAPCHMLCLWPRVQMWANRQAGFGDILSTGIRGYMARIMPRGMPRVTILAR